MEVQNRMYPYQLLSPDVWSECLSYLPPNELSDAFELLPLSNLTSSESNPNDSIKDVEHAAWLSVVSMAEIAHRFWENEDNPDEPDTEAIELQRIIAKDTSIVADLFRNNKGTTKTDRDSQTSYQLTRFQDETWQNLYGFLYSILSESREYMSSTSPHDSDDDMDEEEEEEEAVADEQEEQATTQLEINCDGFHDHEAIALAVGLVFGIQPTRASMTPARRKKMQSISSTCTLLACGSPALPRSYYKSSYSPTEARSYALSLRLAQEGFWYHASEILQSRIRSFQDKNNMTTDNESVLSIDGMIYVSTFLIDRMYSQTFVRNDGEDDKELATAVRLGRKAVTMAKTRYDVFLSNIITTEPTTDSRMTKTSDRRRLPPPPIESLFANDALRYINAKLALGKALSLLAQHVGLLATNPGKMEISPAGDPDNSLLEENLPPNLEPQATPLMVTEREKLWKDLFRNRGVMPTRFLDSCKWIAWPILFFEESRVHLKEGLEICQEYSQSQKGKTRLSILPLIGALESAEGERMYCASSASTRYGWQYSLVHYLQASIGAFSSSFNKMMNELIQHAHAAKTDPNEDDHLDKTYIDATLDCLLRCGKDFGKTCGFGDQFGIDYRQQFEGRQEEQQKLLDKKMVFEFVYLVSIHRHGSFHPTTENVLRLGFRFGRVKSIDEMYTSVVAWLLSDYRSH